MNKFLIAALLFLFNLFKAKAQDTNQVEKPPACHVNFTSTANNHTDNSSFVSNNNLRFNIAKDNIYINTFSSWIYGSQTSGLTNNNFFSSLDFNL